MEGVAAPMDLDARKLLPASPEIQQALAAACIDGLEA
jgi:hypothetical protein